MAVVSVREGWSGIQWSGDSIQRQTVRVFTVLTDAPGRGVLTLPVTDPGGSGAVIPSEGTAHPDNSDFVSGVPTIRVKGPTLLEVSVPYVAVGAYGGGAETNADPLDEPADISWTSEVRQVAYDRDLNGLLLGNVMGESFDPPLTREIKDPVLVIERNEAAFDPNDKLTYQDTISSSAFWGAAVGRARLTDVDGRSVAAKTPYFRRSYRVVFRMKTPSGVLAADAWKRYVLHTGSKYIDGNGVVQQAPNGQQVLLAADGTRTDSAIPTWLGPYVEFGSASWAGLAIGSGDV